MQLARGTEIRTQALIFDMDGTLIDSQPVISGIWRRWATNLGFDPEPFIQASPGRRIIETVRMLAPARVDAEAEAAILLKAASEETEGLIAVPGAETLLRSIPKDRWAVVTSAGRKLAESWLHHAGLPIPNVFVAAEDVTAGKPDPSGFLLAASRLGFQPHETIVFEDAPAGLEAGRRAGAKVIAVATMLSRSELTAHDWIPDFSRIEFTSGFSGSPILKIL